MPCVPVMMWVCSNAVVVWQCNASSYLTRIEACYATCSESVTVTVVTELKVHTARYETIQLVDLADRCINPGIQSCSHACIV